MTHMNDGAQFMTHMNDGAQCMTHVNDGAQFMTHMNDVLIVGAGIAGLTCAIRISELNPKMQVHVICNGDTKESSSYLAQGGVAAVLNQSQDSFHNHMADTLSSGGPSTNADVVRNVVEQGPAVIDWLKSQGVQFDPSPNSVDGKGLHQALEGGHSAARVVHCADSTGRRIMDTLLRRIQDINSISITQNVTAKHLFVRSTPNGSAPYIVVETSELSADKKQKKTVMMFAKSVVLATGGYGNLFSATTNPPTINGDGIAMAFRAGVGIRDVANVQYHPTVLYGFEGKQKVLITEALRGAGAYILSHDGRRFLFDADIRGELATRDIVSEAIHNEIKRSGRGHVFIDCRHIDRDLLNARFSSMMRSCEERGIDPTTSLIPVCTAAHYQNGGIVVDGNGATSVKGLYAIGECAYTGMHGANRLASNSLLEGVVFAWRAARDICKQTNHRLEESENYVFEIADKEVRVSNSALVRRMIYNALQDVVREKDVLHWE